MKSYKVIVNGTAYEVSVEEIDPSQVQAAPAAAPAAAPTAAPAAPAAAPAADSGEAVSAPMPGTILDVKVQNGQQVKEGDILFILEAMKMENEIFAPCNGTVSGLNVAKGATVETGTPFCFIG